MNKISFEDLQFKHPFNAIVYGAASSGKTEWIIKFLKYVKNLITPKPASILYCYGIFDERIVDLPNQLGIEVHSGIPSEEVIKNKPKPLLLVLDDLLLEANSTFLTKLFTRDTHHMGISAIFVTQNLYDKAIKTARNNAHYIVLLKNPSGELQVKNIGIHLFPRRLNYFLDAYEKATSKNFGYLLIDMHPTSKSILRLRTHIFPNEFTKVYLPK